MTCTVACTNGVGVQTGKLFAFDAVSTVSLTGLASAYNGLPLTGYVTTRDGKVALAPLATCTAGNTTASLAFDFRTRTCRGLFTTGSESNQEVRLRVMVTATGQVVCDALLDMVPGPEAGTTTTSTGSAAATLAEAQALVDLHNASATAHALTAGKTPPVDADRVTLWDSAASYTRKYLTWANLKSALASVFAALAHTHTGTTDGSKLAQAATHESADTDTATTALHHTTGTGANQAAAGNHAHAGTYEPAQTAATQAEAEAGTVTGLRSWSPLRVKQAIVALGGAIYAALTHASRHGSAGADPVTPAAIGAATSGANADITSLAGLTTPLSVAQGGTGGATAAAARTGLSAAPLAAVRHVFWPAGAAIPRTTNGAAVGTVEAATNDVMYDTFDFDSATDEGVAWVGYLEHWGGGTIKCKPVWTCAAGIGGANKTVCFSIKARAYANDDAIDQDGGTPQSSTDTWIADGDIHVGPATAAITVGGSPANGQAIILQAIRDVSEDDLAGDARLLGVWIEYTEAATEEAAW